MLGSKCDLKTHVRNVGYHLLLQIYEPKTTFFRRLHNLTANLTAHIFRAKHDIDNRQVRWQLEGVFYIVSKRHELWSTNCLKSDRHFTHST